MALPADTIVMYYNAEQHTFQRIQVPDSWFIHVTGEYSWHFSDMDSDSLIYLDKESALEVEAGYQAWRRYYREMCNPTGEEGAVAEEPPKELKVRQGWYADKEYLISYDPVPASRASARAIEGRHIEVFQQNVMTGFNRTLIRSPVDSIAKPYSGLKVDAKIHKTEGGLKIYIDVAAGKSFFGYQYERTVWIFEFSPEERMLAVTLVHFCEDGELFQLEIPRDEHGTHHIFAQSNGTAAFLGLKKTVIEFGIQEKHWERHIISAESNISFPFESSNEIVMKEGVVGEPDHAWGSNLCEEKHNEEGGDHPPVSKFDLYSCIKDCSCQMDGQIDSCQHRAIFNRFSNDDDQLQECERYHQLDVKPMDRIRVPFKELQNFMMEMVGATCDIAYMIFDNAATDEQWMKVLETFPEASAVCKDAVYNKLVHCVKSNPEEIFLVTVKVSRLRARDCEWNAVGFGEEYEFVTYLGFDEKIVSITRDNVNAIIPHNV